MDDFLVFDGVVKRFGEFTAVEECSFSVRQGEIFALLGPSGCGKTTLLRLLAGLLAPDAGRILVAGEDVTALPPEKRPVNTVFQSYALFPHLSVRDNIAFGLKMAKRPRQEIDAEVDRMLDLVDLREHASKKPHLISGGQKQRVAIARALVNKPRVLLLDEPLAALDLKLRQRLLVELDEIHDEVGTTFLYVTHDQTEAMAISDRIAVMRAGQVQQIGTPAEIYEAPLNPFVATFIGDTNLLAGVVAETPGGEYSRVRFDGVGESWIYNDRPLSPGERVALSLRPEKIGIARLSGSDPARDGRPGPGGAPLNEIEGVVEEVVYLGSLTRYRVRAGESSLLVERQHTRYLLDDAPPAWQDQVRLSWWADDGCLLAEAEDAEVTDETSPPEEAEAPERGSRRRERFKE